MPYLIMELVEGKTLGSLLKAGPLPAHRACQIAIQVARGMQAVHAAGIVHRDLKPDNIIVREDPAGGDLVKIIDFGIAKQLAVSSTEIAVTAGPAITRVGAFLGSPRYMSPEQAKGRPDVDFRTDVYSLGCILYHMLTGSPPFDGESVPELIHKHLHV